MALTAKQKRFAEEYLIDLNATQAAIRAGYSPKTANEQGARLLANVSVQTYIAELMEKRELRTKITQDMVLQRWWEIATADPNELTALRRLNCRFCHGIDHEYQWRDEKELESAMSSELMLAKVEDRRPREINANGGFGYDELADPHPDCPSCNGEGTVDLHFADTRKLKGASRLLFAGVKQTKFGIEVSMQDQGKALENVARHLGMFKDKVELSGNEGGPLQIIFSDKMKPPE